MTKKKEQTMNTMDQDFVENFDACLETLEQELPEYKEQEHDTHSLIVDTRPNTLSFLEQEEMFVMDEEWEGMPEFIQENEKVYQSVLVKFETKEHFKEFEKLMKQTITDRTKSIYYPKREQLTSIDMFWVHDQGDE